MSILDSHCHLNDDRYDEDIDDVLNRMLEEEVTKAMIVSLNVEEYKKTLKIEKEGLTFKRAIGVYPGDVDKFSENDYLELEKCFNDVDAIGEIGLDYHYGGEDKEKQKAFLERQLCKAEELDKPVIIHSRDAINDTYEILRKHHCRGVIHCYSDSAEMAKLFVKLGYYISISGTITFENAKEPLRVIRNVPLDRLLIETDCPYLTPVPNRGKRNEPSYVRYTFEKIRSELGLSKVLFEDILNDNYNHLFG